MLEFTCLEISLQFVKAGKRLKVKKPSGMLFVIYWDAQWQSSTNMQKDIYIIKHIFVFEFTLEVTLVGMHNAIQFHYVK